jgi:hypothetical protein
MIGGAESGLLEFNKLAADFGLWLGHPHAAEDLNEAVRLQKEHEAKVKSMAPSGTDWARMGGEMLSPVNFLPGPERAIKGAGTLANVFRGALAGGKGALSSPTEGVPDLYQKGKQVGAGMVGGAVMGGAIPEMSKAAKALVNEGVRLTPGMKLPGVRRAEEAARSFPVMGVAIGGAERAARDDFNRAVYNRVLAPIGEKYEGPVGTDGIAKLRDRLSAQYSKALKDTTFVANDPGTIPYGLKQGDLTDLNNVLALMTNERRQQFDKIVNQFYTQRVPANHLMDGEAFKRVESDLSAQARRFTRADDPDQHAVGEGLEEVVSLLRQAHMAQNPAKAAELQAANHAYKLYVVAERAAGNRALSNGVMTPGDFLGALKAMDSSVRKNYFSRGRLEMQDLAQAGNEVMTPHLGTSGTAERSLMLDLGILMAGGGGARFLGIPQDRIGEALAALAVGTAPYLRAPSGWPTANLGTKAARAIAPVVQGAAAPVGTAAGTAIRPSVAIPGLAATVPPQGQQ